MRATYYRAVVVACLVMLLNGSGVASAQRSPDTDQSRGMLFDSTLVLPYWTRALNFDRDPKISKGDGSQYEAHWRAYNPSSNKENGELIYSGWLGRAKFDSEQDFWSAVITGAANNAPCPTELEVGCIEYPGFKEAIQQGTMGVSLGTWGNYDFVTWWLMDPGVPQRAIEWYDPGADATYRQQELGSLAGSGSSGLTDKLFPTKFLDDCVNQTDHDSPFFCWKI